jgi:hypothetical protein
MTNEKLTNGLGKDVARSGRSKRLSSVGLGIVVIVAVFGVTNSQASECERKQVTKKDERISRNGRSASGDAVPLLVQPGNRGNRRRDWNQVNPDKSASAEAALLPIQSGNQGNRRRDWNQIHPCKKV